MSWELKLSKRKELNAVETETTRTETIGQLRINVVELKLKYQPVSNYRSVLGS